MKNLITILKHNQFLPLLKNWFKSPNRIKLLKWSGGFFSIITLLQIFIGFFYISNYRFPTDPLALVYTFTAFFSHFGSISLIVWISLVIPLLLILPDKKLVIPICVLLVSFILCVELLDAQLFTSRRFHLGMLTIKILGWKTWGFGILYFFIFVMFNSLIAKITWDRFIIAEKKVFLQISIPLILVFLVFTHLTHIWADATGYVEVTRFTTRLPLFYPSTSKRFMVRHGLADISQRRNLPEKFGTSGSDFYYPQKPLEFNPDIQHKNILIIAIDAMRYDMLNSQNFNRCYNYARNHGTIFTNHYSGGNSTKMGSFTLFYGIPPTYQQYVESNKKSPVLIDRILETGYNTGIFTSYKLYAPANLDVTAFVKIPDLRLETTIPGPQSACRNDSAITDQWKSWVHQNSGNKPFFGFLFYDALCTKSYPESYSEKIAEHTDLSGPQKKFIEYKISLQYIDSLVASVLDDLSESDLLKNTVVIITSDHGEEFDDNGLGYNGHGSSFSDWQIKTPLITVWPEMEPGIVDNRTSHYDIAATLMKDVFGVLNPESDFCSGKNLFSDQSWDWLLIGSYFNFAILEPQQITVQFPGGYYEVRGKDYRIIQKPQFSPNITAALNEMGRFFNKN